MGIFPFRMPPIGPGPISLASKMPIWVSSWQKFRRKEAKTMETNDLLILAQWLATVARCPCGMDCIKLGRIDCPACPYRPQVQKGMGGN